MKKFLALILALVVVLSFTGCVSTFPRHREMRAVVSCMA